MARLWLSDSASFMWRRSSMRHWVTRTVKNTYSTSAASVIQTNQRSNFKPSSSSTSVTSRIVGTML